MRFIASEDSNARSHKHDATVLEFELAETDSFIKNKAAKTGVFVFYLILWLWNVPYNGDFRNSLEQITIAKQSHNLSGATGEH